MESQPRHVSYHDDASPNNPQSAEVRSSSSHAEGCWPEPAKSLALAYVEAGLGR